MSEDAKGLKFYLCQTEDGPQLEHLQAEAKKRDPNFKVTYVDTAKQPLMDRLNDLMRRVHSGSILEPQETDPEVANIPSPPPPPASSYSPVVQAKIERTYDQIGFEKFIWDIPDSEAQRLDVLEGIIKERRREIKNKVDE